MIQLINDGLLWALNKQAKYLEKCLACGSLSTVSIITMISILTPREALITELNSQYYNFCRLLLVAVPHSFKMNTKMLFYLIKRYSEEMKRNYSPMLEKTEYNFSKINVSSNSIDNTDIKILFSTLKGSIFCLKRSFF
jgi:hypothetical protein